MFMNQVRYNQWPWPLSISFSNTDASKKCSPFNSADYPSRTLNCDNKTIFTTGNAPWWEGMSSNLQLLGYHHRQSLWNFPWLLRPPSSSNRHLTKVPGMKRHFVLDVSVMRRTLDDWSKFEHLEQTINRIQAQKWEGCSIKAKHLPHDSYRYS